MLSAVVQLDNATIAPEQTTQAAFIATTPDGKSYDQPPHWSSLDTRVATVNSSGLVTAIALGTVAIRATAGLCVAEAPIVVSTGAAHLVIVSVAIDSPSIAVGHVANASAVVKDSAGNPITGQQVAWESLTTNVATVSSTGIVTAVAPGTAHVQASVSGSTGSDSIIVNAAPPPPPAQVASVTVSIDSSSLLVGHTSQARATAKDASGNVMTGLAISWASLTPTIASVSSTGSVQGLAAGNASIQATVSGVKGTGTTVVTAPPPPPPSVASVTVAIDSATLLVGHVSQARATAKDASGNVMTGLAVSWTSLTPSIASVSSTGSVQGLAAGTASIQATVSGVKGAGSVVVNAAAPPPPPPTGTILAFADFNDGTLGPYTIDEAPPGGEVDVVADPTGSGRGKVARMRYQHFTTPDRNISVEFQHPILPGETVFFKGEFYVATGTLSDFGRKLLYWQQHTNYTKYGWSSDGSANFSSVLALTGTDMTIDNFHVDHTGAGIHDQHYIAKGMLPNKWYTLEMQTTAETPVGAGNGICRIWLNGVLIYESTTTNWVDPAMIGKPLPGGNGTPLSASDVYFEHLLVGEQVNDNSNSSYDEYRYWDNVTFSTGWIP